MLSRACSPSPTRTCTHAHTHTHTHPSYLCSCRLTITHLPQPTILANVQELCRSAQGKNRKPHTHLFCRISNPYSVSKMWDRSTGASWKALRPHHSYDVYCQRSPDQWDTAAGRASGAARRCFYSRVGCVMNEIQSTQLTHHHIHIGSEESIVYLNNSFKQSQASRSA